MKNIVEKIAFDLFREWTKKAVNDFPDLSFTIIDERKIVRDFKTAFSRAIHALLKEEKGNSRLNTGYDYGFVLGFIAGHLNSFWGFEYITKQTDEFKHYLINISLLEYLKSDTLTAIKINTLYDDYYELLTNLDLLEPKISQKITPKCDLHESKSIQKITENTNPIIHFLSNQVEEMSLNLSKKNYKQYLLNLEANLTYEFIKEEIKREEDRSN
jgi:hypothetical protein